MKCFIVLALLVEFAFFCNAVEGQTDSSDPTESPSTTSSNSDGSTATDPFTSLAADSDGMTSIANPEGDTSTTPGGTDSTTAGLTPSVDGVTNNADGSPITKSKSVEEGSFKIFKSVNGKVLEDKSGGKKKVTENGKTIEDKIFGDRL